jgi:hypothetical protein
VKLFKCNHEIAEWLKLTQAQAKGRTFERLVFSEIQQPITIHAIQSIFCVRLPTRLMRRIDDSLNKAQPLHSLPLLFANNKSSQQRPEFLKISNFSQFKSIKMPVASTCCGKGRGDCVCGEN